MVLGSFKMTMTKLVQKLAFYGTQNSLVFKTANHWSTS